MTSKLKIFKTLHTASELFILPNAWDAESAVILQACNYPAVGTSSAAVATTLGYTDGEGMPFTEYLIIIRRIAASVDVPVTVDMEMGYGKSGQAIYANLQKLLEAGVVGINIEDSMIAAGKRSLKDPKEFAGIIAFIKNKLKEESQSLFVNVRCDTYLVNAKDKDRETAHRLKLYESAGADGIFLPFISEVKDIANAVAGTSLPVNVMTIPGLPNFDKLNQLGVRRVSMGPFWQKKTYSKARELAKKVADQKSIKPII
jgi:2-methylisocitrate lyase-like PEP mutase family enzyme